MNRIFISFVMLFSLACNREGSFDKADDLDPESPFTISVMTDSNTKGAIVKDAKDMGSIGVYCAMTGDEKWTSTTEFLKLKNRLFNISSGGNCVIDGETEYWEYETPSDKYTIFAYSPHSGGDQGITPRIEGGELVVDYVVPKSSLDQPDLMYALPYKDMTPQSGGRVPLSFFHALSCVSFGVVSTIGIKILAIDISGFVSEGSVMWDYDLNVPKWSLEDVTDEIFSVKVEDYTLDKDSSALVNSEQGYLMMIPQVLTNGVKVTLSLDNGAQRSLMIPVNSVWEAGARYQYIINLDDECGFIYNSTQISNCYIINPVPGEATIVQVPIEDRINDFWKNYAGEKKKITAKSTTDEFTVQMVWEDFDGAVDFSYEVLDDADEKMAVRITFPAENQEGNFVFEVQTDDGNGTINTLWSWHLWFTDYNPDAIAEANVDLIEAGVDREYLLDGYKGAVHRYKDGANTSASVWSGIYKDKFIMDRNIGERNAYAADYGAGAVYYQFGRKDPFPGRGAIFYTGNTQPSVRKSTGFGYDESVEYSCDFFVSGSSSSDNWCDETAARLAKCIWFDGNISTKDYSVGKSIFDPSPLGWRVPVSDTWSNFNLVKSDKDGSYSIESVGKYSYYGCRNPDDENSGALTQAQEAGYVWSANPLNDDTAYCLYCSDSVVNIELCHIMTYGFPIRAIQE